MTKDQIRAIFMANGFTIKDGQADLKPYVYEAAEALLAAGASDCHSTCDACWGEQGERWPCAKKRAAGASEGQAVCVDCGDTIMAHDPGTCGNCHSMKYVPATAEIAALRERIAGMEKDAERLLWFSRRVTVEMLNAYTSHVLSRGGDGDLSDIRTFIDAAIAKERQG